MSLDEGAVQQSEKVYRVLLVTNDLQCEQMLLCDLQLVRKQYSYKAPKTCFVVQKEAHVLFSKKRKRTDVNGPHRK